MKRVKKIWNMIETFFVKYMAIISFCILFVTFIIQISFRYLFEPLEWCYEITVMFYIWTVLFGACFAMKSRSHVCFTMVYEKFPLKVKAIASMLANLMVIVVFLAAIPTTVKYISDQKRAVTAALGIGLNLVYAPYLVFMFFMLVYTVEDFVLSIRILFNRAKPSEIKNFHEEGLSEYEIELKNAQESEQQL